MSQPLEQLGLEPSVSLSEAIGLVSRALRNGHTPESVARLVKDSALGDLGLAKTAGDAFLESTRDDATAHGRALVARAYVHCVAQELSPAGDLLGRAEEIARREGDARLGAEVRLNRVQLFAMSGRLEDARRSAEAAQDAFESVGDGTMVAHARINLGIVLRMLGRLQESLDTFELARPVFESDPLRSALIASNQAETLLDLDRFDEAERAFERAYRAFVDGEDVHGAAIVEGNIADLLARQGRLDEALHRFEDARVSLERAGSRPDAARLLAEEAEALLLAGATSEALAAFDRGIRALDSADLRRELGRALLGRARSHLRLGDRASAIDDAKRAGAIFDAADMQVEGVVSRVLVAIGRLDLPTIDGVDGLLAPLESRPSLRSALVVDLGEAALESGEPGLASELASRGELAEAFGLSPLNVHLLSLRARIALAHGDAGRAISLLGDAASLGERLRDSIRAPMLRTTFAEAMARGVLLLGALLAGRDDPGDAAEAFRVLEFVRARGLTEETDDDRTEAGGALRREHERCVRALHMLYDRIGRDQADVSLRKRVRALEANAEELSRRRQIRADDAPDADEHRADAPGALRQLGASRAILSYFIADGHVNALIGRGGEVVAFARVCSEATLADHLGKLALIREQSLHHGTQGDRWARRSRRLYADLVEPLIDRLAGVERLFVSKTGALGGVPLGALHDGERFLVERFDMRETPSVTLGVRASRRGRGDPGKVTIVGVADEAAPEIQREIEEVAALHADARVLVGRSATVREVTRALRGASLVHIAAHGVLSPDRPLSSRLALSDGWLTAREFAARVEPGARVVLGACSLGASGGAWTEDRSGFVHALLGRGAREVVCAAWPLHDRTARELLVQLHENWLRGAGSLGHALRQSQIRAARSGEHPGRWAALTTHGGFG